MYIVVRLLVSDIAAVIKGLKRMDISLIHAELSCDNLGASSNHLTQGLSQVRRDADGQENQESDGDGSGEKCAECEKARETKGTEDAADVSTRNGCGRNENGGSIR